MQVLVWARCDVIYKIIRWFIFLISYDGYWRMLKFTAVPVPSTGNLFNYW
jgi:hypothetical protein